MTLTSRWSDATRVLLQVGIVAFACLAAFATRKIVAANGLSDAQELTLNSGGLALLLTASLISVFGAGHARRRAPRAALSAMAASLFVLVGAFVWLSYPAFSIELVGLIAPAEAGTPTSIVIGPDGHDVRLSGVIRDGAADRLAALLDQHSSVTRIHLTSEGGLADEGQALGEVIAAHHLTTYVPDFCVSACTLAFVGGRERLLMQGARLGFHAPYEEGLFGQTFQDDASDQRAAYLAAGLAPDFVDAALKVAPDDMWFPGPSRLVAAHVVTGFVDSYRFPDSGLDGIVDARNAKTVLLRNFSVLRAFEAASPFALDRIEAWYLAAYRRGGSEGNNVDRLTAITRGALALALVQADDGTLLHLAQYIGDGMAAIGARTPASCAAMGSSVDLLAAEFSLDASGTNADEAATAMVANALAATHGLAAGSAGAPVVSIAIGNADGGCTDLRRFYADVIRRRDPSPLRRRLAAQVQRSAATLAEVLEDGR